MALIARDTDENPYLDESCGILLDSSCYSETNHKYHVRAYVDL